MLRLIDLFTDGNIGTTVDVNGITVGVNGTTGNLIVGEKYEIRCEVYTDIIVHSDIVNITWIGPNNDTIVNDSRTDITTTNSVGRNHTSTLQFLCLSENDTGSFTCSVTILNNTYTQSLQIGEILSKSYSTVITNIKITAT